MKKQQLLIQVVLSFVLAIAAGLFARQNPDFLFIPWVPLFDLIGKLFLNALTLAVIPLVASSIISGAAKMGGDGSFGKLGSKVAIIFILTSTIAVLIGAITVNLIEPGLQPIIQGISEAPVATLAADTQISTFEKIGEILLKFIPSNIFMAASQGQILGLLTFCMLFGYFSSKIEPPLSNTLLHFFQGVFQVMMKITGVIMKAMPFGVFGLIAKTTATSGFESLHAIGWFAFTAILSLGLYAFIALPLLLKTLAGVSPKKLLSSLAPALLTGFTTSSSAATLPVTLECLEKRAGLSNRICSFVLPLGTSLNLTGTALYQCVAVFFIAEASQIEMNMVTKGLIIFLSLVTSFGVAGIPSGSLISILLILHTLGMPVEKLGLLAAIERLLDMCRTPINIFGTACASVLVARSEGEKTLLADKPTMTTPEATVL